MTQFPILLIILSLTALAHAQPNRGPSCWRDENMPEPDTRVSQALNLAQTRICKAATERVSKTPHLKDAAPFAALEQAAYYYDCREQKVVLGATVRSGFQGLNIESSVVHTSHWFDDGDSTWPDSGRVLLIPSQMYAKATQCRVIEPESQVSFLIEPPTSWNELRVLVAHNESEDSRLVGTVCRNNYESREVECQWTDSAAWKLRVAYAKKDRPAWMDSLYCRFIDRNGCAQETPHFTGQLVKPATGWKSLIGGKDMFDLECE